MLFPKFIHIATCQYFIPFYCCIIFYYMGRPHFIYLLSYVHFFWLLWIKLLWTFLCGYVFLVLPGINIGLELLGHMGTIFTFKELIICFPRWLYCLQSLQQCMRAPGSLYPHQHLLLFTFLILATLVCVKWFFIELLGYFLKLLLICKIFTEQCTKWPYLFNKWSGGKRILSANKTIFAVL